MLINDLLRPKVLLNTDLSGYWGSQDFNTRDMFFIEGDYDDPQLTQATDFAILNKALNPQDENFNPEVLGKFPSCRVWLRTGGQDGLGIGRVYIRNEAGKKFFVTPYERNLSQGISPRTRMDLSAFLKVRSWLDKNRKDDQQTLSVQPVEGQNGVLLFGEYPQKYVGDNFNKQLEQALEHRVIVPTGKTYTGCFDKKNDRPNYYFEYEVNGKRYVRVNKGPRNDGYWVEVTPLVWEIENWNDLPVSINPQGSGTAVCLDLAAKHVLMAGIPFYPNLTDDNNNLWQNSSLRGFLNGINVNNIKENGNTNYTAPRGGDFTHYNFIQQAFASEIEILKMVDSYQKKTRLGWGIKIEEKPLSVNEQLQKYIQNGHTVMLHGPSGIGKSQRVKKIDPDFVSITLRNGMLPEEIIGKNIFLDEKNVNSAQWQAPAWYNDLCEKCAQEPNKQHVLFIDEITNVREQEQSAVFHIILEHSIGPNLGKLPANVSVVAAGNSLEESLAAYQMAEPLERRFFGHVYIKPNIPEWLEWASEPNEDPQKAQQGRLNIHPLVAAFVASVGMEYFCPQYDQDNPPKYKIDPRGWQQISDMIYDNGNTIYLELIRNKIGPMLADTFMTFAKTPALTVQDIVSGNYARHEIPHNLDMQYAMAMMWRYAKMDEVAAVRQFIDKEFNHEILAVFDEAWANTPEKAIFLNQLKQQEVRAEKPGLEKN